MDQLGIVAAGSGWAMRSRLFGVGLAVAALAVSASEASEARSPGLAEASRRAVEAAAAVAALAPDSGTPGGAPPPRAADPAVGRLLDAVFDTAAIAAARIGGRADMKALLEWLNADLRAGQVYVLAGTGRTFAEVTGDPAAAERVNRNVLLYAREVGRWYDATAAIEGGTVDAAEAIMATEAPNAQTRAGSEIMRAGVVTSFAGDLETLKVAGLDDGWRSARLTALVALAGKARSFLDANQCAAVRDMVAEVRPALTGADVRTKLDAVAAALRC